MHPGHAERQNALRTDGKLSIQRPVQPAVATYNEYRNRAPRVLRQLRTNYNDDINIEWNICVMYEEGACPWIRSKKRSGAVALKYTHC